MLYIFICKYNTLASSKFPALNKAPNPLNKTTKTTPAISKKGSVMFDDGDGIIYFNKTYTYDYYDLNDGGYYAVETGNVYYREKSGSVKQTWNVNYIK